MVEHSLQLDAVFSSLADGTRRDILKRVAGQELSVGEIAQHYNLTFAAISKHLIILERAKLVVKQRRGKQQFVGLSPAAFKNAEEYLEYYGSILSDRLDVLENYIIVEPDVHVN